MEQSQEATSFMSITANSEKILIVAPAWLGDAVMSNPLLRCLKKRYANCTIDVLSPKGTAQIYQHMVEVDNIIISPFEHGDFKLKARRQFGKTLKPNGYTRAYVLPNSWKSALIPYAAGIAVRIGWLGESRYVLLNDHRKLDKAMLPLMVQRFVALCFAAGKSWPKDKIPAPRLTYDKALLETTLNRLDISVDKPVIVLCPGAAFGPAKQWPSVYWTKVAQHWHSQGYQIWLIGSPIDNTICEAINYRTNDVCLNLCGKTSLSEAVALIDCAQVVVSNDSGSMHIAAALNKPQVAIFGSSSPLFTPPLNSKATVLSLDNLSCKPCFKRTCPLQHLQCLNGIKPNQVIEAMRAQLESEQQ
jgi:heptosyltransferase-2